MNSTLNHDDSDAVNRQRRRFLGGVAGAGATLAGLGTASARDALGAAAGDEVTTSADEVVFDGFRQVATGSAELTVENDNLVVSNFDGGLDDGTCVPLDDVEAFQAQTTLDRDDPFGSARRFLGRGNIDGEPGQRFGFVDVERVEEPNGFTFQPDFQGLGAEQYGLRLFDDGDLVLEEGPFVDPTIAELESSATISPSTHLDIVEVWCKWVWSLSGFWIVYCIDIDLPFYLPDGSVWGIDEIWFCPWDPIFTPGRITECDIFGFGMRSFTVFAQALGSSGFQ